jgi:hypothetical protein
MSEFDDGDSLRPEKKKQGDNPEPDCDAAVSCDRRDYVQIEDGDHEKQHQVAAAEDALQVRLVGVLGVS